MCPYYNEAYRYCKIYKTTPTEYTARAYCMECEKDYKGCPNYREMVRVNGYPVPPYKY